ncbi:MAG: flavodoxin domain-containing protein [Candidatus Thorarchaeota archaeon]|jgi:menaquinone-dependent protoporphyrinogen oxidase
MMNKVLICYGTRYGTTTEVVQEMSKTARELGAQVDVVHLEKGIPFPEPEEYDLVIVGSGIQAGQWTKRPLKYIEQKLESLSKTKVALFVVSGYAGNPDKVAEAQTNYLDKMSEKYPGLSPISTALIGGMFEFKKYNLVVRALVKSIAQSNLPPGEELPEKIDFRDWDMIRDWIKELVQ